MITAMRKEASLPVRLDPDEKRRLRAAAEAMGMTPSALIRLLVRSFVEEYERSGGRIALPPRWESASDASVVREPADEPAGEPPLRRVAEKRGRYLDRNSRQRTDG